VDDNATNRLVLHYQLRNWHLRNEEAAGGEAALKKMRDAVARGDPFHIAILDLQMPGLDGLMLARAIKQDPVLAETDLIMLTSLGSRLGPEVLKEAGVVECLLKPVKQSRLYNCLMRVGQRIARPAEPREHRARPVVRSTTQNGTITRILLAEDNAINQRVTQGQLQKLGYTAEVVTNGRQVLQALERQSYDIILMDGQMPEMEGYEATRQIRQREATGKSRQQHVYIIALTANAMEGDREKCLTAGMDDYLSKPVRAEALAEALERWRSRRISS
jgi:two-component system sensor histidine kinase/response regulator